MDVLSERSTIHCSGQKLTTAGSTKAVQSSPSSKRAKTNEIAAEARRMRTSWSWNCSRTNFQRGVASSSSRAVKERSVS